MVAVAVDAAGTKAIGVDRLLLVCCCAVVSCRVDACVLSASLRYLRAEPL